jgi:hypothetical protein
VAAERVTVIASVVPAMPVLVLVVPLSFLLRSKAKLVVRPAAAGVLTVILVSQKQ